VDQVLADVPQSERCQGHAEQRAHAEQPSGGGLMKKLFGRS